MRILRISILLLIPISVFGQDIMFDKVKKEGFYADFFEFRTNSPSIEGEVTFIKNDEGAVTKFYVGDKILDIREVQNKYWGFCRDSIVYFHAYSRLVSNEIATPINSYYQLNLGYHSFCIANTKTEIHAPILPQGGFIAGFIAGAIDGLVDLSVENNSKHSAIITINHQSGKVRVADKREMPFLLLGEEDLKHRFDSATIKDNEVITQYLDEFNKRKHSKNELNFNARKFWPTLTIVRKTQKQTDEKIEIYVNDSLITHIENKEYFQGDVPYSDSLKIEARVQDSDISLQINIDIDLKERVYLFISHSAKKSDELIFKKSDATRTKYIIDELK